VTPSPYPPTSPVTATDWALLVFMFTLAFLSYWLPTILALWRHNSRMGLVIFVNLGAFMIFPWVGAMTVVLGEHSRRPQPPPVWTPEQAATWAPPPELPQPPAELPPNVTQLRRGRGTPC